MGDFKNALEDAAVLLVIILSAPLASILFAVLATYLILLFYPLPAEGSSLAWGLFGTSFAVIYLTICAFALSRK